MTRSGCERAALAAAAAWLWSAGSCPTAQAQTPAPGAPIGAREAAVDFDIPAQPMNSALNAWAIQANAQIFVDPGPVAHLLAPAIKGTLTPRAALRALLARSNLQVTQGTDGVVVIKPRPAQVATAPPVTAAPAPPQDGTPAVVAAPLTARASEGPWLLGLSATYAQDPGTATGGASAAIGAEYFITDHVAAALAVTAPRTHSFEVPGGPGAAAYRASARLQSSAASLKYYFTPENRLDPYVGVGIDVTALYDATGVTGLTRATVGPSAGAGLDLRLGPHWLLNAAINWAPVRPSVAGSPAGDLHLDPLQFGLGFVYRFGASP